MATLTEDSIDRIRRIAARYPQSRSALLPALYVAQEQIGFVTDDAICDIADILALSPADVKGVATFYTMYYHKPAGRYVFQVCGTLSCALCGAGDVIRHLEERLGVSAGEPTPDGKFMFEVVECLGACGTAPVVLLGDRYYENLTLEQLDALIDDLKSRPDDARTDTPQLRSYAGASAGPEGASD